MSRFVFLSVLFVGLLTGWTMARGVPGEGLALLHKSTVRAPTHLPPKAIQHKCDEPGKNRKIPRICVGAPR